MEMTDRNNTVKASTLFPVEGNILCVMGMGTTALTFEVLAG